jgi:arsenite-transporting ATPase
VQFRFVAGKGGVGKTTLAAARAIALADAAPGNGGRVLIVSTDPAHSLGDALLADATGNGGARALSGTPVRVPLPGTRTGAGPGTLLAAELAAGPAYERWLGERRNAFQTLAERGSYLAREDIARLLELPVPGVDELVGLLELMRLAREADCAHVVVDTAPTAHTLRLLAMPAALERLAAVLAAFQDRHRTVAEALSGTRWRDDDADAIATALADDARALGELVRDPQRTRFTWVLLPEALSLAETQDALAALRAAGAHVDELVINRVTPPVDAHRPCAVCAARRAAEAAVIEQARRAAPAQAALLLVPELDEEPRGIAALRALAARVSAREEPLLADGGPAPAPLGESDAVGVDPRELSGWLDKLAPASLELLLFGGKGGVGKTTCAAALALLAARRRPRQRVLLLSIDPAHSVGDVLDTGLSDTARPIAAAAGAPANLEARELDAPAVFAAFEARYRDALDDALSGVVRGGRSPARGVDASLDRAVIERLFEATPPGLDELVALCELSELTDGAGGERLIVVDTAPTGHALRLLEMPRIALQWDHALLAILLEYRNAIGLPADLAAELVALSKRLTRLRTLLADAQRCGFVVVTRAGELPWRETHRLVDALHALDVAVPALILNAVPDGSCTRCRRCAAEAHEAAQRLRSGLGHAAAPAILLAPAEYPPPRGPRALERWARRWRCA